MSGALMGFMIGMFSLGFSGRGQPRQVPLFRGFLALPACAVLGLGYGFVGWKISRFVARRREARESQPSIASTRSLGRTLLNLCLALVLFPLLIVGGFFFLIANLALVMMLVD